MAGSSPLLHSAQMSALRTNQTYAGAAIAGAAFSRTCSVAHLAAQQISPERLLRGLKLGALKPIFRRARLQRSGLGL